jgi:hypothetical protein
MILSRRNSSSSSTGGSGGAPTSRRGSTLDVAAALAFAASRRGSRAGVDDTDGDLPVPLPSTSSPFSSSHLVPGGGGGGGGDDNRGRMCPLEHPLGQELADRLRAYPSLAGSANGSSDDVDRRPSDDLMGNYLRAFGALASGASEEDLPGDVVVTHLSETLTSGSPVRQRPCSTPVRAEPHHTHTRRRTHAQTTSLSTCFLLPRVHSNAVTYAHVPYFTHANFGTTVCAHSRCAHACCSPRHLMCHSFACRSEVAELRAECRFAPDQSALVRRRASKRICLRSHASLGLETPPTTPTTTVRPSCCRSRRPLNQT